MVDPTRNRLAGRRIDNVATLPAEALGNDLRLIIKPPGKRFFPLDLSPFRDGRRREDLPAQVVAQWTGDFTGRPKLIEEFVPVLAARYGDAPKDTWDGLCHAMRVFWRYLDADADFLPVASITDLNDAHGVRFQRYVFDNRLGASSYTSMRTILRAVRAHLGLPDLYWAGLSHETPTEKDMPDRRAVIALYTALKSEGRRVKAMFAEGDGLVAVGCDPRGEVSQPGSARWQRRENHAWLLYHLTRHGVPTRKEFDILSASGLYQDNGGDTHQHGPEYLAPNQTGRARQGIVGKLRWFYPSAQDTAIFFLLVLIGTGWNLSTACEIDVSSDEAWEEAHPTRPDLVVIRAWKGRSGQMQPAISLRRPEWHPYQIIRFMIARTRPLRDSLRRRQAEIEALLAAGDGNDGMLRHEQEKLSELIRSPWLFLSTNKVGEICKLDLDGNVARAVLKAVVSSQELAQYADQLLGITTRTFRDAWIGFAYEKSGYQWLVAQIAAGHATPETLRRYLAQRRWRLYGEKQIRALQAAVMHEIRQRRIIDPAALRILVDKGEITDEQRARLEDYRMRTRIGTGCKEPRNPPRYVDPNHREGTYCRVQRCVICHHAVVFDESLEGLCRRKAELIVIQERTPVVVWANSSYADEMETLNSTLELFDFEEVRQTVERHLVAVREDGLLFEVEALTHEGGPT